MPTPANNGVVDPQVKAALASLTAGIQDLVPVSEHKKLQTQVDAIDSKLAHRLVSGPANVSLLESFKNNEQVSRLIKDRRGRAVISFSGAELAMLQRKSIISATAAGVSEGDPLNPVGVMTTGVLQIDRTPGITVEARQTLKIRDILSARATNLTAIDFVKVSTPLSPGQMVPEASTKPENSVTFTSFSERVKLIATTIPASKQVIADFQELLGFIESGLGYYINLEEETQLLAGDNTGENLHGLIPQAMPFNPALLLGPSWTYIDVIGTAVQQINAAKEIDPTFVVLNTNDWWVIRLTKDSFGRYILGDPQIAVRPNLFGLDVVPTTSIAPGTFLVGSSNPAACEIRDRMELVVEVSTEHNDFFVKNLVMFRAEKRLALVTPRPNSFVSGTFTRSPV